MMAASSSPEQPSDDPKLVMETDLTDAQLGFYIDIYKKYIDVQQHFNDIQWRIRGLALTVATFAIGAAGVAAKDGTKVWILSLGALVAVCGLLLWEAFYYVDRSWYHPFLKSAVDAGDRMEVVIRTKLPDAGMTSHITAMSPQEPNCLQKCLIKLDDDGKMHSVHKLSWFYKLGRIAFVLVALVLQVGACLEPTSPPGVGQTPIASSATAALPPTP